MQVVRMYSFFVTVFLSILSCKNASVQYSEASSNTQFQLISEDTSSVHFINKIEDQQNFNILSYRNYYNGGGVGIGDINNDGLKDVFFTSNMGKNTLYLNKGNFHFEDISEKAGIGGSMTWSTGVAMADVNADGLLDIYVCNSGDTSDAKRKNELYINRGNLSFKESAAEYGLDDAGYSTHAAFFDYDLDGDLDCFVLNNSYTDPQRIARSASGNRFNYGAPGGDRIYQNDGNGKFSDVTKHTGIFSGDIDFGLGVSVGDVNGDLWPDLFISNDFWERDYLYINQKNGTFKEELTDRTSYVSSNSMGSDIGDINNDGSMDIFSTDMLPSSNLRLKSAIKLEEYFLQGIKWKNSYFYQYIQNCLHVNDGEGHFLEAAHYAGISATDWSWGALMYDMNLDGYKDIFVSNGIYRDITDLDFIDFIGDQENIKKIVSKTKRSDFRDYVTLLPNNKQSSYAFINRGSLNFINQSKQLGLGNEGYSNGSAYGDLDNDGDFDLVVNNVNMPPYIYKNTIAEKPGINYLKIKLSGPKLNPQGIGTLVKVYIGSQVQTCQSMASRGFESSVDNDIIFGLGLSTSIDSLQVIWPDFKTQFIKGNLHSNQIITLKYEEASSKHSPPALSAPLFTEVDSGYFKPSARHIENNYNDFDHERLMPHMLSTESPKLIIGDVNGDGQKDIIMTSSSNEPNKLYLKAGNHYELRKQDYFELDKQYEDVCGALIDLDNDKDLDLVVGVGGNESEKGFGSFAVRWYYNDQGNFVRDIGQLPFASGQVSCIRPCDFNNDGKMDMFIGGKAVPGAYGLTPRSFLIRNDAIDGENKFVDVTTDDTGPIGMVTDAIWEDLNQDKMTDLITVGEWMPITVFGNKNGFITRKLTVPNSNGWWNVIHGVDLDGDGDKDFIIGNWGLNFRLKASDEKPLKIYCSDFDLNGKPEGILEWYAPEDVKPFPFASKSDLTGQMPSLKKVSLKYRDYAQKQLTDLFSPQTLMTAVVKKTDNFATSILWNDKDSLRLEAMPFEAQLSPVFAVETGDFDQDGQLDIYLGGNFYGLKPELGRQDGNWGGYFKGLGKGKFKFINPTQSGIKVKGEVRDVKWIDNKLIIARNNETVKIFQKKK